MIEGQQSKNIFFRLYERFLTFLKECSLFWRSEQTSRVLWVFFNAFPENPIMAVKLFNGLLKKEFQEGSFILRVCGPRLFRTSVKICEAIKVKPFMAFGTLRGFVLRKDFLPNSDDIDLGLWGEDFKKKHLIKEALLQKGYKCTFDDEYLLQMRHPKFPHFVIDFFHVYREDDAIFMSAFTPDHQFLVSNRFPLRIFKEFSMVKFQHMNVLMPVGSEEFLAVHYGEEWKNYLKKFEYYEKKNAQITKVEK
jgi:phosphorylcholine metabolism protein LicD